MKRKTWIIGGVTLTVLALAAVALVPRFATAGKPKEQGPAIPEFVAGELGRVRTMRLPLEVLATGTLAAERNATVRAKVSAEVREVGVREGEPVQAGQLLVRLDTVELMQKLASQEGNLASAQARLASAKKTRDMQKALLEQQYISQNAFDAAQSAYDAAAGEVTSAQAQVALARQALGDAVVRAPVAGVVAKRYVQPGEKVSFDAPLIQIVDLASLELQAWVPPQSVAQLSAGQAVKVQVDGVPAEIDARLKRILPAADPATRQIGVVIDVPNREGVLKVGMQATGRIRLAERDVLTVPSVALTNNNGDYTVWVLRDGKVRRQPVQVGQRDDARGVAEIIAGKGGGEALKTDDVVLAGRYDGLKDGQAVKVVERKATPAVASSASKAS